MSSGILVRGAPPILRVFSRVVGSPRKVLVVCREPIPDRIRFMPAFRGIVLNTSCPSRKKSLFSGKNVSHAVRLTTTSSDSTTPKSGLAVAVIWTSVDGLQEKSIPARISASPDISSEVADTFGKNSICRLGTTPGASMLPSAVIKRGEDSGKAGQLHRSSM